MTINTEDLLNSILESVGRIDYIHPVDIPNIDLYMDQVTTFMETLSHENDNGRNIHPSSYPSHGKYTPSSSHRNPPNSETSSLT